MIRNDWAALLIPCIWHLWCHFGGAAWILHGVDSERGSQDIIDSKLSEPCPSPAAETINCVSVCGGIKCQPWKSIASRLNGPRNKNSQRRFRICVCTSSCIVCFVVSALMESHLHTCLLGPEVPPCPASLWNPEETHTQLHNDQTKHTPNLYLCVWPWRLRGHTRSPGGPGAPGGPVVPTGP